MTEIMHVNEYYLKRRYFRCLKKEVCDTELHIFPDSSEKAYGVVSFLRVGLPDNANVQQIIAKSRVAPLKKQTIPRLELMAAALASKMYENKFEVIGGYIQVDQVYFWCDS